MAQWWTASGTVEALGNSQIQPDGTIYSVVRLRQPDATVQTLIDVMVAKRCHVLMSVGADIAMAGVLLEKKSLVVGLRRDGETLEDIDTIEKSKKGLLLMGILSAVLGLLLVWTVFIPLLLAWPVFNVIKNASKLPSRDEMNQHVAALAT